MILTYDIHRSYEDNYHHGPRFDTAAPPVPVTDLKSFLGIPVRSRLGIAAGLLLNSKWIEGYARFGFDLLTYKTVRTSYRPCYPLPNWVFVDAPDEPSDRPVYVIGSPPKDPARVSSAVCFGMPSMAPEVWRPDVARAKQALAPGQALIVSVVATPGDSPSPQSMAADFRQCAVWAAEAGADVIEANLSCPNVCSAEGSIYMDHTLSRAVVLAIREGIGSIPLLVKVGHVAEESALRGLLRAVNGAAQGLTLVNAITRPVLHRDGQPVFGKDFVRAGVLGRAIHQPSVAQVRQAAAIIHQERLDLVIAAVGGVSTIQDAADFFEAGAQAVLLGSSPMYQPRFAIEAKQLHPEW